MLSGPGTGRRSRRGDGGGHAGQQLGEGGGQQAGDGQVLAGCVQTPYAPRGTLRSQGGVTSRPRRVPKVPQARQRPLLLLPLALGSSSQLHPRAARTCLAAPETPAGVRGSFAGPCSVWLGESHEDGGQTEGEGTGRGLPRDGVGNVPGVTGTTAGHPQVHAHRAQERAPRGPGRSRHPAGPALPCGLGGAHGLQVNAGFGTSQTAQLPRRRRTGRLAQHLGRP